MSLSSKIIALLAVLAALVAGANKLYDSGFDAGRKDLFDEVRVEAEKDWKVKLDTAQKRIDALVIAFDSAKAEAKELEALNVDYKARIAAGDRITAGLRATLVSARRSEVRSDPGGSCSAQELRSERLAGLLEEGQRRCVDVAEQAAGLEQLVLTCEAGARSDAMMLRWSLRAMEALRLGAEAPGAPEP